MTLDQIDKFKLYQAGFTDREIAELDSAVTPKGEKQPDIDLNSPAWQAALKYRNEKTSQLRREYEISHKRPLDRRQYEQIVNQWYRSGKRKSPWDWLKIIYQPRLKKDFNIAVKTKIRQNQLDLQRKMRTA
jgi:hypothetical protein